MLSKLRLGSIEFQTLSPLILSKLAPTAFFLEFRFDPRALGHAARHTGLRGYCTGLVRTLSRKRVEPMSARVDWAADPERHAKAGVPEEICFATKTQIALQQLRTLDEGAPRYCVLADAGYGVDNAFRQSLSNMGLLYAVGVTSAVVVWPPGVQPLPPKHYSGVGRPPVVPRRTATLQPMSVKALAMPLPPAASRSIPGARAPTYRLAPARVRDFGLRHYEDRAAR